MTQGPCRIDIPARHEWYLSSTLGVRYDLSHEAGLVERAVPKSRRTSFAFSGKFNDTNCNNLTRHWVLQGHRVAHVFECQGHCLDILRLKHATVFQKWSDWH